MDYDDHTKAYAADSDEYRYLMLMREMRPDLDIRGILPWDRTDGPYMRSFRVNDDGHEGIVRLRIPHPADDA